MDSGIRADLRDCWVTLTGRYSGLAPGAATTTIGRSAGVLTTDQVIMKAKTRMPRWPTIDRLHASGPASRRLGRSSVADAS